MPSIPTTSAGQHSSRSRNEAWPCNPTASAAFTGMVMQLSPPVAYNTFWALMEHWDVPDLQALKLIDQAPNASGKRPRFALSIDQVARLSLLSEIDRHAGALYRDPGEWLRRPNRSAVFNGRSPLDHMLRWGVAGFDYVLLHLDMMARGSQPSAAPRAATHASLTRR